MKPKARAINQELTSMRRKILTVSKMFCNIPVWVYKRSVNHNNFQDRLTVVISEKYDWNSECICWYLTKYVGRRLSGTWVRCLFIRVRPCNMSMARKWGKAAQTSTVSKPRTDLKTRHLILRETSTSEIFANYFKSMDREITLHKVTVLRTHSKTAEAVFISVFTHLMTV